ncbi:MAG: tetratricopeptide repeat protein [Candidatus Poribacteria bacterium]|nr:tetratricopeptide repeat protein [Candidatus Poribacteria bacterium]
MIKSLYCLLISITAFTTSILAETADLQYRYAEQLFESGDYRAARLAYKRLQFYDPDTEFRDIADYRIAQSYYYQNEATRAEGLFRKFSAIHPNSPLRFQSQLMLGQLHFDAGAYSLARRTLFELLHTTSDPEVVEAAHYLRGWCYIHTTDWNKAISELRQVGISQTGEHRGKKARELADILLEKTPLPAKSPQVADLLSTVVPGSGQLYAGKIREGLLAAALNGTFIYLAVDAIRERRYVDCVGISLIGWRFYWGNRTDARRFTTEYNAHHEQALIETLNRQTEVSVP